MGEPWPKLENPKGCHKLEEESLGALCYADVAGTLLISSALHHEVIQPCLVTTCILLYLENLLLQRKDDSVAFCSLYACSVV